MKPLILLYHYYCRAVVLNSYSGLDFKTTSMRTDDQSKKKKSLMKQESGCHNSDRKTEK